MDPQEVAARARLGQVLRGKWTLERVLGIGGMATVYAASHRNGLRGAVKILDTLVVAHAAGIVHRDIKPETEGRGRGQRIAGATLVGVGGASLFGFGVLAGLVASKHSAFESASRGSSRANDLASQGKGLEVGEAVLLALGIAGAGSGIAVFATAPSAPSRQSAIRLRPFSSSVPEAALVVSGRPSSARSWPMAFTHSSSAFTSLHVVTSRSDPGARGMVARMASTEEGRQQAAGDSILGPARGRVIRVVIQRSRLTLLLLLFAALVSGLLAYVFSGGEHLSCSRERCTLSTWHVAETFGTKEVIPLADIQRAELAFSTMEDSNHHKTETYAIALVVGGKQRIFGGYTNVGRSEKEAWIDQVNAFLGGDAPTLDVAREHSLAGITWLVAFGLVSWLYYFLQTSIEIDPGRNLFIIHRTRSSVWSRELPVERVTQAFITAVGSKGSRALALRIADAPPVQLTVGEGAWRDRQTIGRDAINSALAAARRST